MISHVLVENQKISQQTPNNPCGVGIGAFDLAVPQVQPTYLGVDPMPRADPNASGAQLPEDFSPHHHAIH